MTPKSPNWPPKMMPTWLYRQDFSKFSLNRHYKGGEIKVSLRDPGYKETRLGPCSASCGRQIEDELQRFLKSNQKCSAATLEDDEVFVAIHLRLEDFIHNFRDDKDKGQCTLNRRLSNVNNE
ncbi:hypothetical protein TNCV_4826511 [Trichonephila clavipes]|nr:hypothetical protein TNCV_4826511 [Trichonephila clavipes]